MNVDEQAILRVEGISKMLGGKPILNNCSLSVRRSELKVLIGPSGAGKSTLLQSINCLIPPDTGDIYLEGQRLDRTNKPALCAFRAQVGMIFQDFNLFDHLTAEENVAIALRKVRGMSATDARKRAQEELARVGLARRASLYPAQLSGGQKQRVAIARALANDPEVLLCDEATSALDPKTTSSILALLKELNKRLNLTIVIITHEMQVVKEICNKVAVMENGGVIEYGSILDIFTKPQNQLTKDFIDTATHVEHGIETVITHPTILNLNEHDVLTKLSFVGGSTGEPLIAKLANTFNVQGNILFGNVEILQDTPVGTLLLVLSGTPEAIAEAVRYLQDNGVTVEIITEEIIAEKKNKGGDEE